MANKQHSRGWTRIGIVLSVIWFIGFAGFLWTNETSANMRTYEGGIAICKMILDNADNNLTVDEYLKHHDKHWAEYKSCQDDTAALLHSQFDAMKEGIPIFLAVDAATILIGWLLVWGFVAVVKWIKRGFVVA